MNIFQRIWNWLFGKGPTTLSMAAADWDIQYSPGLPTHPTAAAQGWYFDFPIAQAVLDAVSVNYVTTPYSGVAAKQVSMTFSVSSDGPFNGNLSSDNTGSTPASVRFFLQQRGDDMSGSGKYEFYRWWADQVSYELKSGHIIMTVQLTPDQWSSVMGRAGLASADTLAGFKSALANLGHVGMTFGGGSFFGHGVNAVKPARFTLESFSIQ